MEETLNKRLCQVSKYAEWLEIILISIGVFLVPIIVPNLLATIFGQTSFIATNSQYVVGTLVNTALIMAAINISGWKKIIGIVTLPSISAMLSGYVFQTATIYTVYMIPAIWIGNFLLIYLYKHLFINKNINYIISSIAAILFKVIVIYMGFMLLLQLAIIPNGTKIAEALGLAMGINQAITAVSGAMLSYMIMKIAYKRKEEPA